MGTKHDPNSTAEEFVLQICHCEVTGHIPGPKWALIRAPRTETGCDTVTEEHEEAPVAG